jgi:hypothetical protein
MTTRLPGDPTIFVQIASFRDPQLPPTIASALAEAARPGRIVIGVCQQHGPDDEHDLDEYEGEAWLRLDRVPARDARGVGWARARANKLWAGEDFLLQIDSHTRFAAGWDDDLIDMWLALGRERAIVSAYPPSFEIRPDGSEFRYPDREARRMELRHFRPNGTTAQRMQSLALGEAPRQALLAAGFLFANGRFTRDVPYDPSCVFDGEELSLAVRAYTHGYDVFGPTRQVLWHRYGDHAPKIWDQHPTDELVERWLARLHRMLRGEDRHLGGYGLGTMRSLAGFESLAGFVLDWSDGVWSE